jgi:hypothetical protein
MKYLIGYLLRDFFRSFRYFVPSIFFLIFVVWMYTVIPTPVMPSYSTTAIILYMFSAWLTMNFLTSEPIVQQQITALQIRSKLRYAWSRIIAVWMITAVFTIFTVIYPIIIGAFDQQALMIQIIIALYGHLLLALLGILSACIFHCVFRTKFIYTFGGLLLCLAVSVAAGGIANRLPEHFAFVIWLLPPAGELMYGLTNYNELSISKSLLYLGYPLLYLVPFSYLTIRIMNRNRD